jgi:hypothetical protein
MRHTLAYPHHTYTPKTNGKVERSFKELRE